MKIHSFRKLNFRRLIFAFCLGIGLCVPGWAAEACSPATFPVPLHAHLQYQTVATAPPDIFPSPRFGKSASRKDPHKPGIITGSILFFSGGMLYAVGHVLADQAFDEYQRSAFTGQTDRLRRQLLTYNVMRFGGGALGGLGLIAVLVSF